MKTPITKSWHAIFEGFVTICIFVTCTTIAHAEDGRFALIVGIGNYSSASQATQLLGVPKDMQNARRMAQAMGVDAANIVELQDKQATKTRIISELDRLRAKVKSGDRVLFYFSGHGSRFSSDQGCVEGLQTYTPARSTLADILTEADLAKYTRPISERADKLIVFIDACFSEGVLQQSTRSLTREIGALRPRFNPAANAQCSAPVNTRNILSNLERMGIHSENFVQISAANRDEVSWDTESMGGLVTHSMSQCLMGEARDLNRSGAISLEEVRACAQTKLNALMKPHESRGLFPSTIQVRGNRNLIAIPSPPPSSPIQQPLAVEQAPVRPDVVRPPVPVESPATPAPTTSQTSPSLPAQTQATTPELVEPPSLTATPPSASPFLPESTATNQSTTQIAVSADASIGAIATLADIFAQRNPRIKLDVTVPKSVVIDQDLIFFSVRPGSSGYLYILMLGTDEKSFYLLYPNKVDGNNRVEAGRTYNLPGPGWKIKAGGPTGTNRLLFVVSKSPRDPALFISDLSSGGGIFTYAVANEDSRARLIDFFIGRGAKGSNRELGAILTSIEERP
jgi:hypothetical protein